MVKSSPGFQWFLVFVLFLCFIHFTGLCGRPQAPQRWWRWPIAVRVAPGPTAAAVAHCDAGGPRPLCGLVDTREKLKCDW